MRFTLPSREGNVEDSKYNDAIDSSELNIGASL